MIPADEAAILSEIAKLIEVALWNRGGSVKNQGDTTPPTEIAATPAASAVARR